MQFEITGCVSRDSFRLYLSAQCPVRETGRIPGNKKQLRLDFSFSGTAADHKGYITCFTNNGSIFRESEYRAR
jgi:hypothetical protein